jgi:hypothetical protein
MKLIGSWKCKYIGFTHKGIAYYVCIQEYPEYRHFGYIQDFYDAPIHRFCLWYIEFQSLYDDCENGGC